MDLFKIVAGSSCDMTVEMREALGVTTVPFKITIDGKEYVDDDSLDVFNMIDHMNKSKKEVRTSCPAPGDFLKAYRGEEDVFVLTISKNLSGAYNSASLARDMARDEDDKKRIHIFDTESASAGETLIAYKLREEINKGLEFDEIVSNVDKYIKEVKTFFILESLNNLIRNGRISKTTGLIANVLNFKPIMQDDGNGNIELFEKVRGTKKAFTNLVKAVGKIGKNPEGRRLVITHVNAMEKAEELKAKIIENYNFKEVITVQTRGLCSAYADDGGIVLAY